MIFVWKNKGEIALRVKCWSYDSSSENKELKMELDISIKGTI